jgi:hypothetical protein
VTWSPTRPLAIALTLIGVLVVALLLWRWRVDSDPQGNANVSCTKAELDPIGSATGVVVSGHNTVCDGFGGDSAVYLYVHRVDEKESSDQLVLRYSERTDWELPKIEWTGENQLMIRVKHVIQVTKKATTLGSVKISYQIEQEDYPSVNSPKGGGSGAGH